MKTGVTLQQVKDEFAAIVSRLASFYPDSNAGNSVAITTLLDDYVGDVRSALFTVFAAVGCCCC